MKFDELVRLKALQIKAENSGRFIMETLGESQLELPEVQKELKLRQVCAMLTPALFARFEATCSELSISKREFITQALSEAIDRAEEIVAEIDPFSNEQHETRAQADAKRSSTRKVM